MEAFKFLDYIDIGVKVVLVICFTLSILVIGVFCIGKMCGQAKPAPKDFVV